MNQNPYKFMGPLDPVGDKIVCVPRTGEVEKVINGVMRGDYWTVLGPGQIGKTTFLRQIKYNFHNAHCIYFDLEVLPSNVGNFYLGLMKTLLDETKTEDPEIIGKIWRKESPALSFFDFLRKFKPGEDKKIIFLFDKIDTLPFLANFLRLWRKIFHERYHKKELYRYNIIITGSVDLIALTIGPNSPFNISKIYYIKDFSRDESNWLISTSLSELSITIDQEARKKIIFDLSGHPQMLQHACSILVEKALASTKSIVEKDVEDAIELLLVENDSINTLRYDLEKNKEVKNLVKDILKGKDKKFHPFKEFSIMRSGPIVDSDSYCAIRNKVYEKCSKDVLFPEIYLIKVKAKDCYFDSKCKKALPFALKQLQIKDYYGIRETGISDIQLDAQWIFLTGENAFGKTAVLRALILGLFGNRDGNTILTGDEKECRVSVELHENKKTTVRNLDEPGFQSFIHFAAYGPIRLNLQSAVTQNIIKGQSSQTYSIFNTDGILLNIEYELQKAWYVEKNVKRFEAFKQALLTLMPNIVDIRFEEEKEEKGTVVYIEKDNEGNPITSDPTPFGKLASGHRSIVAMVGDILIRLSKKQPEVQHPQDLAGIVVIDELDLHLHPKWLRKFPTLLSKVFPNVQFIVSTHSEMPILGAPEKSLFYKVLRNNEDGIKIKHLDIIVENLLPNSVLTSDIFDMEEIKQINKKDFNNVRTENFYREIIDNDKIRELLESHKKRAAKYPELSELERKPEKDDKSE